MQRAIDYIEESLTSETHLDQIAKASSFSPFHFHKVFTATVGEPVKTYIRNRRMTEAAKEIRASKERILDVAIKYQFESQESFSRAFKKTFGLMPGVYRNAKKHPRFLERRRLNAAEIRHRLKGIKVKSRVVSQGGFSIIGMEYCGPKDHESSIGALWGCFQEKQFAITNRISPDEIGYCFATREMVREDTISYIASVKVRDLKTLPPEMVGRRVKPSRYAVFTHDGSVERIRMTYDYIYGIWFPQNKLEPADLPTIEIYDHRFKMFQDDSQFELWVPIKEGRVTTRKKMPRNIK